MAANTPEAEAAVSDLDESVASTHEETGTGLDENVAGALSYLFGFVTGVIFLVIEDENEFVRFHAAQSIATFGMLFLATIVFSVISGILTTVFLTSVGTFALFSIVSLLLSLAWLALSVASLGLWVFLMVRAYQGKTTRVPIAAGIADRLV